MARFSAMAPQTGNRNQQAINIASTIAWAVEHDAPIAASLRSLLPPPSRQLMMSVLGVPFLSGFLYPIFRSRAKYCLGIRKVVTDLDRGIPLPAALEKDLGRILPPAFIAGIRVAVDAGREKEVIPLLANSLQRMSQARAVGRLTIIYLLAAWLIATIGSGLIYFIIPKFKYMIREMGEGELNTPVLDFISAEGCGSFLRLVGTLASFLMFIYLLAKVVGYFSSVFCDSVAASRRIWLGSGLAAWAPFIRKRAFLRQQIVGSQVMHACLTAGAEMTEAAVHTASVLEGYRGGDRWGKFAHLQYKGLSVSDALKEARVCDPGTQWLVLARLDQEQLAEGFLVEANFLSAKLERMLRFHHRVFCISAVMILGTVVGMYAYAMFEPLMKIIEYMAELPT